MNAPVQMTNRKAQLLANTVEHVDITSFDARPIIDSMRKMSFSSRDTARAADIFNMALEDEACSPWLILAGSTSAGGCMHVYRDMVKFGMIDTVVATGASIVDMDFLERSASATTRPTRRWTIASCARCTSTASTTPTSTRKSCRPSITRSTRSATCSSRAPTPAASSSRDGQVAGRRERQEAGSLVQTAYEQGVPIFCPPSWTARPASAWSSTRRRCIAAGKPYLTIDSGRDFRELTDVKIAAGTTGLFMVGGGVPKNFAQDTVVCAEILGIDAAMHKYAVQITVADVRDGACSSSTLKEACSWGKVDVTWEQMVFAEATTVVPLIGSDAYHREAGRSASPAAGSRCSASKPPKQKGRGKPRPFLFPGPAAAPSGARRPAPQARPAPPGWAGGPPGRA
jgi:deoxyhypusine synthase